MQSRSRVFERAGLELTARCARRLSGCMRGAEAVHRRHISDLVKGQQCTQPFARHAHDLQTRKAVWCDCLPCQAVNVETNPKLTADPQQVADLTKAARLPHSRCRRCRWSNPLLRAWRRSSPLITMKSTTAMMAKLMTALMKRP